MKLYVAMYTYTLYFVVMASFHTYADSQYYGKDISLYNCVMSRNIRDNYIYLCITFQNT